MALTFTIAGSNKTSSVLDKAFALDMSLGSDWTCTFQVKDLTSTSGAYRPALDASVVVARNGTNIFKGKIVTVRDEPIVGPAKGTLTTVTARSSTTVTQVTVNESYASGLSLKAVVSDLVSTYLSGFGITLDAGMATGPTLAAQVFDRVSMKDALNHLTDITGWPWRLMPTDKIEMFSPGTKTTAYSLTNANGNQIGAVTWEQSRTQFANRVYVRAGTETQVEKTDPFTGNGVTTTFALTYPLVAGRGYVTNGVANETLGPGGTWEYNAATQSITRVSAPANLNAISITYTAQFPITVSAEDAGDIVTNGLWEEIVNAPDIFDKASALELATGILRNKKQSPKQVFLKTDAGPAYPADTITATFTDRLVSGSHLITHVRATGRADHEIEWAITCLAGSEGQRDWTEMLRAALGVTAAGSSGSGTISGSVIPALSGRFADDVIAHADQDDDTTGKWPIALSNWGNGSLFGPAVRLGRIDKGYAWALTADTLAGSTPGTVPRFRLVPAQDSATYRFALQVSQDAVTPVAGSYYLTPNTVGALYLGASSSSGFGPGFRITGGWFTDFDVTNGITERGRTAKLGEETSYTPTWASSGGTPITVGDATRTGRYTKIGKMVFFSIGFTFGSTSNAGAGNSWTWSLPSTAASISLGTFTARVTDNGTALYAAFGSYASTTTIAVGVTGGFVVIGAGNPMTWAAGDTVLIDGWYLEA